MKGQCLLEVCCGGLDSVEAAVGAGAQRVELCSGLPVGGLTPSLGLIRAVRQAWPKLTLHVLIRPREGDFVYTAGELALMEADIILAREAGADGIVAGALTADGGIDAAAVRRLMAASRQLPFTFHRAFDHAASAEEALETLIELGCARVLTSGQAPRAEDALPVLRRLTRQAAGRIIVMPGGGIGAHNVGKILEATGCSELHASCSRLVRDESAAVPLGSADDGSRLVTDAVAVSALLKAIG